MSVSAAQLERIKKGIRMKFRVFGEGFVGAVSPVALALSNKPMSFDRGVDVETVINFIAYELAQKELPLEKPPGKRAVGRKLSLPRGKSC